MHDPKTNGGCDEYRAWSRREILGGSARAALLTATAPAWLPRVALGAGAGPGGERDILVLLFLRGGVDGLTALVPHGDGDYYAARPTLAVPPPGSVGGALDLDGFFGLPPSAAPLLTPFGAGDLAFVHAAGSPDPTRSHFDAMKVLEYGVPDQPGSTVATGWLARHLAQVPPLGPGLLRALALDVVLPKSLAGAPATIPAAEPQDITMPGRAATAAARRAVLERLHAQHAGPLTAPALDTFATIDLLSGVDFAGYAPSFGAEYPQTTFGRGMRAIATMIKSGIDVEAYELDRVGWDHHGGLGPLDGTFATMMDELARSLYAFWRDMQGYWDRVTLVGLTEFGRRVAENGSAGADHGHGGVMLAMGGGIAGGLVHGTWPGIAPAALVDGDLAITTDYRDVLSEILVRRLGATTLDGIFPNHVASFPGITV